ncbi:MAG: hypothetical protein MR659_00115 [Mollicutes bacterium]|nr:hypothetical protein [Mollicutes bacterium]MDY3904062.1 hypothetical protein [Candidatus Enteromonas sp.]
MKGRHILFSSRRMYPESAEIIFKSDPKAFFRNIAHRRDVDPNGYIDIVLHGTSQTVQIEHNGIAVQIDWRRLANIIKRDKSLKNKPIRLLSCNTGADPNGFAQNLANKLGVKVMAPNKIFWCWPNGYHIVASRSKVDPRIPNLGDLGEFVEFVPGGNKKWRK